MNKRLWALLANGSRARLFEVDPAEGRTHEIADFIHPRGRQHPADFDDARGGHVQRHVGDGGVGGVAFQPRTSPREKARFAFARELADYLDAALAAHRCDALLLVAGNPLLGELRAHLSDRVRGAIRVTEAADLGGLPTLALTERLLTLARSPHPAH